MPEIINRYTTLPVLIDMLARKRMTLISPEKWEDRNDAYYVEKFKQKKNYTTVLGICFSSVKETFHHWKIYASGISGVCVEFRKDRIVGAISRLPGVKFREVSYKWISAAEKARPKIDDLPFLKRQPYEDEKEFRIIFFSRTQSLSSYDIEIDLDFIKSVRLSPFLPEALFESVRTTIRNINMDNKLRIVPSTLLDSERWRKIADRA